MDNFFNFILMKLRDEERFIEALLKEHGNDIFEPSEKVGDHFKMNLGKFKITVIDEDAIGKKIKDMYESITHIDDDFYDKIRKDQTENND